MIFMLTPQFSNRMHILHNLIFIALALITLAMPSQLMAQNAGDTLRVKTFHYGSNTRDTLAYFPEGNLTFEKIILRYNMRCKNGLVSDGSNRNRGCGEWDYSCNTFLVDSSKVENIAQTAPQYIVSNFNGTLFNFTSKSVSDYFDFTLKQVNISTAANQSQYTLGKDKTSFGLTDLNTAKQSGKSQVLYHAKELIDAGFSAGDIQGLMLKVLSAGTANFLKIQMQHTSANSLDAKNPLMAGFTETFYNTVPFVTGENNVVFHSPFKWDGVSNLIIEFSFTNSTPSTPLSLLGYADTNVSMLSANNNYAVDFSSNGHIALDAANLSTIKNEISIAFWALGDAKSLPTNTSVIYGWATDPSQRQLNIHFPWSDGSIYFDCGYAAGGYDRSNKAATPAEYEGKWNHWVFTKNTVSGNMSVYLNGNLWLSGSSKTKAMSLVNVIIGKDQNLQNNYKGKLNELSIWNKALTATEIKDWMNRSINSTHPQYAALLAYLPFNEGKGSVVVDAVNGKTSNGNGIGWTYDRGDALTRMFTASINKPQIALLTGNYTRSIVNVIQRDSLLRSANSVNRYAVVSNANAKIVTHDLLKIDSTYTTFEARKSMVYRGETGELIDSVQVKTEGTLDLLKLNYTLRFPWYNELVSFVTPYGINLDLGITGKNWFLDLTDFAPLLKNKKRLVVAMGGQNQENMEMEFLFIVGKPSRQVLEINQLWQGGARLGGPGINGILNNSVFAPMNVNLMPTAKSFKMKSTITGHGSDGEFEQNGGRIIHTLNVAGNDMSWNSVMDCSVNPMIAQGGTWLIPRQGWCPGVRSKLIEHDITQWVTAGKSEIIDYEVSQPSKSGDYRYIVAHQLVSYGDMNFNLDAKIVDITKPTRDFEYAKTNPICAQPVILVQNSGKTTLKTIKFDYWVNNSAVKQSWHWAGNLKSLDTISIVLPTWGLWDQGLVQSNNVFHCEITEVNGSPDEYPLNSKAQSQVAIPDVLPGNFKIEFRTNNYPTENTIGLYDSDGKKVLFDSFTVANKQTNYTFNLNGCYKLIVKDYGLDGLNWWANAAQGTGFVRFRNANSNALVKTFIADFGSFIEYNFTTNYALNSQENTLENAINLYPNPATKQFSLQGEKLQGCYVVVMDLMGKTIESKPQIQGDRIDFFTTTWPAGVYTIEVSNAKSRTTKKVVVY